MVRAVFVCGKGLPPTTPFGSSSFEPVEKRPSRTGRLGQALLDYGSRQARTCARSKRGLGWGDGERKASRPNPTTPFGSSSFELVEKRPSRMGRLGHPLIGCGSRQARTRARSKRGLGWGHGERKATHPNPTTPFGSSSFEPVEKRPSRTGCLGQALPDCGSRRAQTCARSKRVWDGGMGRKKPPTQTQPPRSVRAASSLSRSARRERVA